MLKFMKSVKKTVPGILQVDPVNQVSLQKNSIISKFNFGSRPAVWKTSQVSQTVPGRALTLRQIAERFASGLQMIDEKIALYDEGRVVIKGFEKLDLTERQEIIENARASILKIQNERQAAIKARQDEEFAARVEKSVQDEIAKREKPPVQAALVVN
ncbi:MAG: hypothetical protein [Microvirus sp.]|nr:MAG: hypothetical protein [Microvirus sp.]